MRSKKRSAARLNRPFPPSLSWRRKRAHIIGVRVSATKAEATTATLMVIANSRNSRPMIPDMNSSGMNTAIRENVIETMVKPICPAPFTAAVNGLSPASM